MISLEKGQKISLVKNSEKLDSFYVGAGWDSVANGKSRNIDIDVHIYLKSNGKTINHLYFLNCFANGISYSGDNTTGKGSGIDESMHVVLSKINKNIDEVELGLNMFSYGVSFAEVQNAFAAVYENPSEYKKGFCIYNLTESYDSSIVSIIIGRLIKDISTGEWSFAADGTGFNKKLGRKSPYDIHSVSNKDSSGCSSKGGFFKKIFGR